ncbi:Hypothetical predicted protein [Olea europaea subsp. europaea]|uniref:Uncharacterized protein n=1 Tax=Olea europaea subsp. europaea TaxID=158383 RepID=A0A8S0TM62_OLEEU|nr:Hypothetical predicted protein [Olea europaea subsp. europaea]
MRKCAQIMFERTRAGARPFSCVGLRARLFLASHVLAGKNLADLRQRSRPPELAKTSLWHCSWAVPQIDSRFAPADGLREPKVTPIDWLVRRTRNSAACTVPPHTTRNCLDAKLCIVPVLVVVVVVVVVFVVALCAREHPCEILIFKLSPQESNKQVSGDLAPSPSDSGRQPTGLAPSAHLAGDDAARGPASRDGAERLASRGCPPASSSVRAQSGHSELHFIAEILPHARTHAHRGRIAFTPARGGPKRAEGKLATPSRTDEFFPCAPLKNKQRQTRAHAPGWHARSTLAQSASVGAAERGADRPAGGEPVARRSTNQPDWPIVRLRNLPGVKSRASSRPSFVLLLAVAGDLCLCCTVARANLRAAARSESARERVLDHDEPLCLKPPNEYRATGPSELPTRAKHLFTLPWIHSAKIPQLLLVYARACLRNTSELSRLPLSPLTSPPDRANKLGDGQDSDSRRYLFCASPATTPDLHARCEHSFARSSGTRSGVTSSRGPIPRCARICNPASLKIFSHIRFAPQHLDPALPLCSAGSAGDPRLVTKSPASVTEEVGGQIARVHLGEGKIFESFGAAQQACAASGSSRVVVVSWSENLQCVRACPAFAMRANEHFCTSHRANLALCTPLPRPFHFPRVVLRHGLPMAGDRLRQPLAADRTVGRLESEPISCVVFFCERSSPVCICALITSRAESDNSRRGRQRRTLPARWGQLRAREKLPRSFPASKSWFQSRARTRAGPRARELGAHFLESEPLVFEPANGPGLDEILRELFLHDCADGLRPCNSSEPSAAGQALCDDRRQRARRSENRASQSQSRRRARTKPKYDKQRRHFHYLRDRLHRACESEPLQRVSLVAFAPVRVRCEQHRQRTTLQIAEGNVHKADDRHELDAQRRERHEPSEGEAKRKQQAGGQQVAAAAFSRTSSSSSSRIKQEHEASQRQRNEARERAARVDPKRARVMPPPKKNPCCHPAHARSSSSASSSSLPINDDDDESISSFSNQARSSSFVEIVICKTNLIGRSKSFLRHQSHCFTTTLTGNLIKFNGGNPKTQVRKEQNLNSCDCRRGHNPHPPQRVAGGSTSKRRVVIGNNERQQALRRILPSKPRST